ncbi:hypothetical protein GH714_009799 [Hevea brasiliensis]|uniref:Uncharacterized protein n=1 Tax=Hevea brasiliensis TaxID=3981 RepID=A0A6A6MLH2_HEVBR|nr:hypothetical protein GH714_009799 [Hevea brasiliensis]
MRGEDQSRSLFGISLSDRPKWQQFLICSSGFFFGYLVNGICEEYVYNRLQFSYGWYFTFVQGLVYLVLIYFQGFTVKQMVNPWKTYVKLSAVLMGSHGLTKGSLAFLNYPAQIMFKSTKIEVLFCSTVVGLPFLIPPMILTGELIKAWNSCSQHPYVYGVLVFEAMATFIGQVSVLSLIAIFGAAATAMITTARKAVTLLLSYMIFTKPLTEQHGTGLLLIAMGIILKMLPDNKPPFRNERVMAGSTFDAYRAEPSQQQLTATVPLDMRRAESSRQHVRALNTQFASWVQAQLKNHPDEIWEDGVRDYLAHASNIMEKFSDVVNWLKANAVKGGTAAESLYLKLWFIHQQSKHWIILQEPEFWIILQQSELITFLCQSKQWIVLHSPSFGGSFSNRSSGLFSNSQSSGLSSGNQSSGSFSSNQSTGVFSSTSTPILIGGQNMVSTNHNVSDDVNDENEPEQPSSPSVKKSEEKGIVVVHEVKCKLYVKESRQNAQKNSLVAIFHTAGEDGGNSDNVVARTFLIRTKQRRIEINWQQQYKNMLLHHDGNCMT